MDDPVAGFSVPVHRSLTEPILLGGAPRAVAILNGTLAAALGLGLRLWIAGLLLWAVGHAASVWAAKAMAYATAVSSSGSSPTATTMRLYMAHLHDLSCAISRWVPRPSRVGWVQTFLLWLYSVGFSPRWHAYLYYLTQSECSPPLGHGDAARPDM